MRGGEWNMLGHRADAAAAATAWEILKVERLDFLALTEAGEYVDDLERLAPEGAQVFRSGSAGRAAGLGSCALLVAAGVKASRYANPRMTTHGWITVHGAHTGPKYACSVVLAGWLRVTVVHYPPSVWAGGWTKAPWRRRRSYREHMVTLRAFIGQHRRRHFVVGDWNATPANVGPYSPRWLARKISGRIIAPKGGTHGRRTIDFAVATGVRGTARTLGSFGSDHRAVTFTVSPQ